MQPYVRILCMPKSTSGFESSLYSFFRLIIFDMKVKIPVLFAGFAAAHYAVKSLTVDGNV